MNNVAEAFACELDRRITSLPVDATNPTIVKLRQQVAKLMSSPSVLLPAEVDDPDVKEVPITPETEMGIALHLLTTQFNNAVKKLRLGRFQLQEKWWKQPGRTMVMPSQPSANENSAGAALLAKWSAQGNGRKKK